MKILLGLLLLTAGSAQAHAAKINCDCGNDVNFGRGFGRSWVSSGRVTIYADPSNYRGAAQRACIKKSRQLEISYRCNLAN